VINPTQGHSIYVFPLCHWEDEKKKVMAMIRQFGLPTFFLTLSAAKTRWPELKPGGIFGCNFVTFCYWRVKFQQRGSPHIHGMFWLKDASEVNFNNEDSISSVNAFIDQFVPVDVTNTDLAPYIKYQKYKHGHSCLKKVRGQSVCRLGVPYATIPRTKIMNPLPEKTPNVS